jgi:hypothetical protein
MGDLAARNEDMRMVRIENGPVEVARGEAKEERSCVVVSTASILGTVYVKVANLSNGKLMRH